MLAINVFDQATKARFFALYSVKDLRAQEKVDLIVLISYLGFSQDRKLLSLNRASRKSTGATANVTLSGA